MVTGLVANVVSFFSTDGSSIPAILRMRNSVRSVFVLLAAIEYLSSRLLILLGVLVEAIQAEIFVLSSHLLQRIFVHRNSPIGC